MNITKKHRWIEKEGKVLSYEELGLLCSGVHLFEQAPDMGVTSAKNTILGYAICRLTSFRAQIFTKICVARYMGLEEKRSNYILAGRATYFLFRCYDALQSDNGGEKVLQQLYAMFPDFEEITGIRDSWVRVYKFPCYD